MRTKHISYNEILSSAKKSIERSSDLFNKYEGTKENVLNYIQKEFEGGYELPLEKGNRGSIALFYSFPNGERITVVQAGDFPSRGDVGAPWNGWHRFIPIDESVRSLHWDAKKVDDND